MVEIEHLVLNDNALVNTYISLNPQMFRTISAFVKSLLKNYNYYILSLFSLQDFPVTLKQGPAL